MRLSRSSSVTPVVPRVGGSAGTERNSAVARCQPAPGKRTLPRSNRRARPLRRLCGSPAQIPLVERTGHGGALAAIGVNRRRTPRRPTPALPSSGASRSRRRLPAERGFRASAVGSGVPAGSGAASAPLAALSRRRSTADRQTSRRPKAGRRRDGRCELYGDEHRGSSRRTHTVVTPSPLRDIVSSALFKRDEVGTLRRSRRNWASACSPAARSGSAGRAARFARATAGAAVARFSRAAG